jgi:hypothetical protein
MTTEKTAGADIVLHMPRAFLWGLLSVFIIQVVAAIWFASTMTAQVRQNSKDVDRLATQTSAHREIGAHGGASVRLTKLEVLVEQSLKAQQTNTDILRDIRDALSAGPQ